MARNMGGRRKPGGEDAGFAVGVIVQVDCLAGIGAVESAQLHTLEPHQAQGENQGDDKAEA